MPDTSRVSDLKEAAFTTANVTFAKVVASPTPTSWSQAYNAGKLFAVLSLTKTALKEEEETLSSIGKKLLSTLEQEYFTLETKNLTSIKQAVSHTFEQVPTDVTACFVVGSIINTILYVFLLGKGKVLLKRGSQIGTVLDASMEQSQVTAASGFLEDHDLIILQTQQFTDIISSQSLHTALDHNTPSEIAEILSPKIHEKEEGGASAIILSYKEARTAEQSDALASEEIPDQEEQPPQELKKTQDKQDLPIKTPLASLAALLSLLPKHLTHSKKVMLSVVIVLVLVFLSSIFFAIKRQEDAKTQALFQEVYDSAQKKYDEAEALVSLNKNLARDDFLTAKKILLAGKPKFKVGSAQFKQIEELQQKVEEGLLDISGVNKAQARQVDTGKSSFLSLVQKSKKALAFTQDDTTIYSMDDNSILSLGKDDGKEKTVVENKDHWKEVYGIGVFSRNIYVLDRKGAILKFVGGTTKSTYFAKDVSLDLSNAVDMAVDGAIYILFKDGSIQKFLRGKPETFIISGLDTKFTNPTHIFTNAESDNLYILDNGNSRIVVLDKKGTYQSQYSAEILKDATHFDVVEKEKKIYVLSKNAVWEIEIK